MTPEPVPENTPAPLSTLGRIMGVYLDPKKAFADIVARPSWLVPVILLVVLALAFTYTYSTKIGWDTYFHKIAENNTRMQQMEPAAREAAIQQQIKFGPMFGYIFSAIGIPISILIVGAIILMMGKIGGATLNYKQSLAITSHGMLPGVISSILAIVVMFLKNPDDFNLQNPLAFNLAAFLEPPPNTGKFVYSLAKSFDLFTFWMIALMGVGIWVASRRMSLAKAIMLVAIPWLVWTFISSGLASVFS